MKYIICLMAGLVIFPIAEIISDTFWSGVVAEGIMAMIICAAVLLWR